MTIEQENRYQAQRIQLIPLKNHKDILKRQYDGHSHRYDTSNFTTGKASKLNTDIMPRESQD